MMNRVNQSIKVFLISLLFILGISYQSGAQQPQEINMSLEQALIRAEQNNWEVGKARANERVAKAQYRQTNSIFLPSVTLSHTGVTTNDPLSAFGFKLKQEITSQADFNPVLLNDPARIDNFSTRIEVQQPLINVDGIYGRKAANARLKAFEFQRERTIHHIRFEVKKAYYLLQLANESRGVIEKSRLMSEANLEVARNNLEQGFVKEADVLAARVRTLELTNQLSDADNKVKQAGEYLAYLLGMDLKANIVTTDSLEVSSAPLLELSSFSEERSDLQAYKQGVQARKSILRSKRMQFMPRVNAFGSYEWNDDKLFGTQASNYMVGARLSWNLFSGYKNVGAIKKAKADLQRAELDYGEYLSRNDMEIQTARRDLKVAFNKIEVSRLAREQASESLRIRSNRYEQGLERTTDLLFSEVTLSSRELDYLNTLYQYRVALFRMELLLEKEL